MITRDSDDDKPKNDVGYKKPPKHSQFKKGRSGNPAGRSRAHEGKYRLSDIDEALVLVFAEKMQITVGEKKIWAPKYQVLLTQFVNKAISGNVPLLKLAVERLYNLPSQYRDPKSRFYRWSEEDEELVNRLKQSAKEYQAEEQRLEEEAKKAGKPPPTAEEVFESLGIKTETKKESDE
jgi:hypothetical protein